MVGSRQRVINYRMSRPAIPHSGRDNNVKETGGTMALAFKIGQEKREAYYTITLGRRDWKVRLIMKKVQDGKVRLILKGIQSLMGPRGLAPLGSHLEGWHSVPTRNGGLRDQ